MKTLIYAAIAAMGTLLLAPSAFGSEMEILLKKLQEKGIRTA